MTHNEQSREALLHLSSHPPAALALAGPRGTGKWDLALQLVAALPASDAIQVDGTIDGARQVKQFVRMMPLDGDRRLAIVDGRRGVSDAAQDAYLKVCEETPTTAALVLVLEDANALHPALSSRLHVISWGPFSDAEMRNLVAASGLPEDEFATSASRGRIKMYPVVLQHAEALRGLYGAAVDLASGKADLMRAPAILSEWSKLDDECKDAVVLVCDAACRAPSARRSAALSAFVDALKTAPSANAEIHWWRACMAQCNVPEQ